MKIWAFICMIMSFFIHASEIVIDVDPESTSPLPWHAIQVDNDERESRFSNEFFIDTVLVGKYGFSEEEAYRIIAGVSRNPRVIYYNKKGKVLFHKHHQERVSQQTPSECCKCEIM